LLHTEPPGDNGRADFSRVIHGREITRQAQQLRSFSTGQGAHSEGTNSLYRFHIAHNPTEGGMTTTGVPSKEVIHNFLAAFWQQFWRNIEFAEKKWCAL
jgi:hypothetical protein